MESSSVLNQIIRTKCDEFHKCYLKPRPSLSTLKSYEILRTIGRGAFGRVLLVRAKSNQDNYAMKVLSKAHCVKNKQIENVINERNLLAALNYSFVIKLFESFQDNSFLYLVMEFAIGGEMFSLLRRMIKFPDRMVKFYAGQVILAFQYMHSLNIVYRDLKPENLLISMDGYLKVADLGFAKVIAKDKRAWTLCGTPDYMAPEIILSRGYHCAVDWWAFGVLLFEMTAGFPPFSNHDQMKTFENITAGKVRFNQHFNNEIKDLIAHLIQIDLSRRYGNLKNGIDDIKNHAYFKNFNWLQLYNKKMDPPFVPKVKNGQDTSNFDHWKDEPLRVSLKDKFGDYFKRF